MTEQALAFAELLQGAAQPELLAWQPLRPGIEFHALYGEPGRGPAAALLRYAPGASVPSHQHGGSEHILVLEGSQRDENGRYEAGTLLVSPSGSRHAVTSDDGCLVLAIWAGPLDFGTDHG